LCGGRDTGSFLNQGHDLVTLVRLQGAQLILHINACLAANGEQILTLHFQFARQRKYADLVFLQAQLLYLT